MTGRLTLDDLCKAMFVAYNKHVEEYYYEPKILVTFSPNGYQKARACAEARVRFSINNNDDIQTVDGYPFLIEREQKEDFIVHVTDLDQSRTTHVKRRLD